MFKIVENIKYFQFKICKQLSKISKKLSKIDKKLSKNDKNSIKIGIYGKYCKQCSNLITLFIQIL